MLLGFKGRFAPFVEDGSKTHTIRATRQRPPKVGEICNCYVNPRQKTMRLLGRFECVKVEEIIITKYELFVIDGEPISDDEVNSLAWRDGFRDMGEANARKSMMDFWDGRLPFKGHIIHWRYQQGAKVARAAGVAK